MPDENTQGKKRWRWLVILPFLALILALLLRSCAGGDAPQPDGGERVYEEDSRRETHTAQAESGKRLDIAVAEVYRISDSEPYFYIGFPESNVYDVVFTLKDAAGKELYRTDYVAPGTSVAIDGTAFLEKGEQKVDCAVSVYERETGTPVSDCTTVVLNVSYQ